MSLEHILQALEHEAEDQLRTIAEETRISIESIRSRAQTEAEAVCRKHRVALQAPLRAEQARILNRARQEALQVVLEAREAVLTSALEAASRRLAELPGTKNYRVILRQLIGEAIETLGKDQELCLRVQSRDLELTRQIVREMGWRVTVEDGLEGDKKPASLGGVMVTTNPDRRINLTNTLGARLQQVAQLYRTQIAEIILEYEPEE